MQVDRHDARRVVRAACAVTSTQRHAYVLDCPAWTFRWNGPTILIDDNKWSACGASCNGVCVDLCRSVIFPHLPRSLHSERPGPAAET